MGDRIAVIDHGKIRQVGTPTEIYDDPADLFVATFVGTPPMNLVARNGGVSRLPARELPAQGHDRRRRRRTEFSFRVDRSEYLGSERIVYGAMEGFDPKQRDHGEIAAGARRRRKHSARRVASLRGAQQRASPFRQGRQAGQPPLRASSPMAAIAEPIAKPVSRFRFILDRREVLGAALRRAGDPLRAAAGRAAVPARRLLLGQRLHDLRSDLALCRPARISAQIMQDPTFPADAGATPSSSRSARSSSA